jgi:hypothetical protein
MWFARLMFAFVFGIRPAVAVACALLLVVGLVYWIRGVLKR